MLGFALGLAGAAIFVALNRSIDRSRIEAIVSQSAASCSHASLSSGSGTLLLWRDSRPAYSWQRPLPRTQQDKFSNHQFVPKGAI
jgi:hypothetical protein